MKQVLWYVELNKMKTRLLITTMILVSSLTIPQAFGNESKFLESQELMRAAFHANVDVDGYHMKDIVIGHGIENGKYIVDVNADFFNSKYWPSIQKNLTSIIGNTIEIEYREGEALNICGEGATLKDGICIVDVEIHDNEISKYMALFYFSMIPIWFAASVFYFVFGKKYKKLIGTILAIFGILWVIGIFTNYIPTAFG